jgi:hypothetical protein
VDGLVAGLANDEGLAPFPGHEGRPRGLAWSRCSEPGEFGDLVDSHRGALLAQLAPAGAEPVDQLLAGCGCQDRNGIDDEPVLVSPQWYPAEPCYQVLLAVAGIRASKHVRSPCGVSMVAL